MVERSGNACLDIRDLNVYYGHSHALQGVNLTLEAGEVLFLPARWSHFSVNLEASMMINYWPRQTRSQKARKRLDRSLRRIRRRIMSPVPRRRLRLPT